MVETDFGYVPIKYIMIGDLVKSINPKTCHSEFQKVTNKYGAETDEYYVITVGKERQEQIRCTETHKFQILGRGWVETKELRKGDVLITEAGNMDIEAIDLINVGPVKVFNIELENNHNYEVGKIGAVVVDRWNSEDLECVKRGSEDLVIDGSVFKHKL